MVPKKKMMSIELKREIIEKHEQGVRVTDLARMYGRSTSMICTVLKQKELIKGITPAKGVTIISKLRTSLHEEMEKVLMVWMTEKQLQGGTLTQSIICEKARAIYSDLLKQIPHTSTNEKSEDSFKASRGWFDNFRKRTGIHSVVRNGEAASLDVKAAEIYIKTFSELIEAAFAAAYDGHHPSPPRSTSHCMNLHSQQHTVSFEEEPEMEEAISTTDIKEILGMWEKVIEFVDKNHPEKVATGYASELFNETCLTHFRNILKDRKKQTSLDSFCKRSAGENEQSVTKKAKTSDKN